MAWTRRQVGALGLAPLLAMCNRAPRDPGGEMARDQLVFGAWQPEPLVALFVLQRQRTAPGQAVSLEAKAFVAARGELKLLFFDRVTLDEWPQDLAAAVAAWQKAGPARTARPSLVQRGAELQLAVQLPSGGLQLHGRDLRDAGELDDPHGRAALQAGSATLTLNGQTWQGELLSEHLLPGARAWVHYRRFAMWVVATSTGALILARVRPGQPDQAALQVRGGKATRVAWQATQTQQVDDATTHFPVAQQWLVADPPQAVTRTGGSTARGQSPSGSPALYDVGVARSKGLLALVSTLAD